MKLQKKILLVHLHSNGDCLYATAVARQIKQDYPGGHLTWAVASFCKDILNNNPYIDAILEIPNVNKGNSASVLRKLKKEMAVEKNNGVYDEVFYTQLLDSEIANYDGCIRSGIFRGYDKPITVPVTPVLRLKEEEIEKVKKFAEKHNLSGYKNVILFEFAPQSGQLAISLPAAFEITKRLIKNKNTAVILSSNIKITEEENIIDGSVLTLRETAYLTHYCTFLIGCTSGISWASTSDAAKQLPTLQIIDPYSPWVNPMSRDFQRFGISSKNLLEIYDNDVEKIVACTQDILNNGFAEAKKKYYSPLPLHFIGTSKGIYNMLCFLQFKDIIRHIRINVGIYGWHPLLIKAIIIGFITAPFKLTYHIIKKRVAKEIKSFI